jgi:hypothetical protein
VDATFLAYFRRHLAQIGGGGSRPADHVLMESGDWSAHPVFSAGPCEPLPDHSSRPGQE